MAVIQELTHGTRRAAAAVQYLMNGDNSDNDRMFEGPGNCKANA